MSVAIMVNGNNDKPSDLIDTHEYLADYLKTENGKYIKGLGFITDAYIDELNAIKVSNQKTHGNQYEQITVSMTPVNNKYSNDDCLKIGTEIAEFYYKKGYQLIVYLHLDTDTRHLHLLMNSVNYKTGKKFSQGREELNKFKLHCNHIFQKYKLDTIKKKTEDMADSQKHDTSNGYDFLEIFDEIMADKASVFSDLYTETSTTYSTCTTSDNIYFTAPVSTSFSSLFANTYSHPCYPQAISPINNNMEENTMNNNNNNNYTSQELPASPAPQFPEQSSTPTINQPSLTLDYSRNVNLEVPDNCNKQELASLINNIKAMTDAEKINNTKIGIAATAELHNRNCQIPVYINNSTNINICYSFPSIDEKQIIDLPGNPFAPYNPFGNK